MTDKLSPPRRKRYKPALIPTLSFYAAVAAVLLSGLGVVVGSSLTEIRRLAADTRDSVLPQVFDRQRTSLNIERLGRFALMVHMSKTAKERREYKLAARILSQDSVFEVEPIVRDKVGRAFREVDAIDRMRSRQENIQEKLGELLAALNHHLETDSKSNIAHMQTMIALINTLNAETPQRFEALTARYQNMPESERKNLNRLVADLELGLRIRDMLDLRRTYFALDRQCDTVWEGLDRSLEALSNSLSTEAAMTASRRFTSISKKAGSSMKSVFISLAVFMSTLIVMLIFIRRDVLNPIVRSVQEMGRIRKGEGPVTLPKARLREIDDIRISVEQSALLMDEIARRTRELERANKALQEEIAERTRTENELAHAKDRAEKADKAKSEFLAGMSHEIRTPMNTILGMAELMMESDPTDKQKKYIEIFRSSSRHLMAIINDVLDLSKIEAGQIMLEHQRINLSELIRNIAELYKKTTQQKGIELRVLISPDLPSEVLGDQIRLNQILTNLVDNAVKFTHTGHVSISAMPGISAVSGEVEFTISDSGIGISRESQQKIFEDFTQADASTTRKYGGTGLGLAISKRLVEIMGGKLELESRPGQGASFRFSVRFERAEVESSIKTIPVQQKPKDLVELLNLKPTRILLAEDSASNRDLLEFYLSGTKCQLDFAENGEEAVQKFTAGNYDLVLMDIQMPVMDGFEATRTIRSFEKNRNQEPTPVIAVTANALSKDRGQCIEAGCTFYLAKPVTKNDLLNAVASARGLV